MYIASLHIPVVDALGEVFDQLVAEDLHLRQVAEDLVENRWRHDRCADRLRRLGDHSPEVLSTKR